MQNNLDLFQFLTVFRVKIPFIQIIQMLQKYWKALHKITKFHLISRCGNFVENAQFRDLPETLQETVRFHKIPTPGN